MPTPNSATPIVTITPSIPLRIEYKGGNLLLVDSSGNGNHISFKSAHSSNWLMIAREDSTATNPTLSPDGTLVAYASKLEGGKILVTSVPTGTVSSILPDMMKDVAKSSNLSELKVCSWTTISWSPKGNRLVFWACGSQETFSVSIVFELGAKVPLKVVPQSRFDAFGFRQAIWLDDTQLLIVNPTITTNPVQNLQTLDVP
jgi:hypothetical protein